MSRTNNDVVNDDAPVQQESTTSPLVAAKAFLVQTAYAPVWLMVALAVLFTLLGVAVGARIIAKYDSASVAVSQQAPAAASQTTTPDPSPREKWESPFRQVTGFDSRDGKSYACADGLTPVQMTMGQVYRRGDTVLTLGEDTPYSKDIPFYPAPQQVSLTVKLGANDALPGFIVQPASQINFPTLYNQATINASLVKGGEATYRLSADNLTYTREGGDKIAGVVACLK